MPRKSVFSLSCLVVLFLATNGYAQYSRIADIVGTDHNLSATGPGDIHARSFNQICYFCHTPHQMRATTDPLVTRDPNAQYPLWNHYLSSRASYGVYSSPSFDPLGTDIRDLGGAVAGSAPVSNLCLSCHDGTVGVNALYKGQYTPTGRVSPDFGPGQNVWVYMMEDSRIGGGPLGLRADHPINFTYDAALAARSVSLVVPISDNGRRGVRTSSGKFLPLFADKMQCASCHDVHSSANGQPFLRASTERSELCLGCHGK